MIKSLLQTSVITLVAGMMFSCTEDIEGKSSEFTTDHIVINLTESADDGMAIAKTRSMSDSEQPGDRILTSKSGKKMYLSCTETPWPSAKTATTRGAKVTTAGISNIGVSASVYSSSSSYTSAGCGSYFFKESVASGTPTKFFWPTSDYKISFFGYYPYNNAAFTVQSVASATGAPTYAYTVPSTIADQQDIMTGQMVDQLGGSSSSINMTLSHRCSAIHFSITNNRSSAITVNSISIEGVKYSGTLNESTWTLSDGVNSSSTNPFTLSYGLSVAASATADITGTSNIFMMLPQSLPATATLKMVVDDEEFETNLAGTWQAGKEYTYNITIGDVETTIDLSLVDNAGNARATMTTANCYMVHAAGKYKLPLVYGNAIKNGATNTLSYAPNAAANSDTYLTPFVNHADRGITNPWIKNNTYDGSNNITVNGAELVWQDVNGLIKNGSLAINGDYLEFEVDADHFTNGNAIIAVKMGSTIVWSWHIWATSETYTNLVTVNTGSHTYNIAPLTLGWNTTDHTATFYQWGRKDPLLPGGLGGDKTVYNINGTIITGFYWQNTDAETLGTNIQKPTMMNYTGSYYGGYFNGQQYNLWSASNTGLDNVSSPTVKTIYDPCPPGFCLPSGELYYFLMQRLTATTIDPSSATNIACDEVYDNTNEGRPYTYNGHTFLFYTTGLRHSYPAYRGAMYAIGENNQRWENYATSTVNLGAYVRSIRALKSPADVWRWDNWVRSSGLPILPVAEQ